MGYALHSVEELGAPFWLVQEQVVIVPAGGCHPVRNTSRKLLLVIGGECRHQVLGHSGPGSDVVLRAGDCLAVPHRCEQRYIGVSPDRETRLHVIRLAYDPTLLPVLSLTHRPSTLSDEPTTLTALAESCLQELRYFPAREVPSLQETLLQLTGELSRQDPMARHRLHALCASLTVLFARLVRGRDLAPEDSSPSAYLISQTKVLLRERLAEPLHLTDIAAGTRVHHEVDGVKVRLGMLGIRGHFAPVRIESDDVIGNFFVIASMRNVFARKFQQNRMKLFNVIFAQDKFSPRLEKAIFDGQAPNDLSRYLHARLQLLWRIETKNRVSVQVTQHRTTNHVRQFDHYGLAVFLWSAFADSAKEIGSQPLGCSPVQRQGKAPGTSPMKVE